MKSSNYNEAKKQIIELFSDRKYEGHRKIVFWYDAERNFDEDIKDDDFNGVKVKVFNSNSLYLKYLLEVKDTSSDYLLYFPVEKPKDEENILLDTLLYSDEYYADKTALTMRNLGLSNTDLRKVIDAHINFFDNKERRKRLLNYGTVNDHMSEDDLRYHILATITKARHVKLEDILKELAFDESKNKFNDIEKYGLSRFFWNETSYYYNYAGVEKLENLLKSLYITAIYRETQLEKHFPKEYNTFLIVDDNEEAEIFMERIKIDKRFESFQKIYSEKIKFEDHFSNAPINEFRQCDLSKSIDEIIIDKITYSLSNGSFDYDFFKTIISDNRKLNNWWQSFKHHYEMLLAAIEFYQSLEKDIETDLDIEEYIHNYTNEYYIVDRAYRNFMTHFSYIKDENEYLIELEDKINIDYETMYLDVLSRGMNKAIKGLNGKWKFNNSMVTNRFFQSIEERKSKKFVIISDALRYEIGTELLETINKNNVLKGTAQIKHAISPVPSVTKFGMAALLPNHNITYDNKNVFVDGASSAGTDSRHKILNRADNAYAAIRFGDIYSKNQKELRNYMKDKSLVYIYHDEIDKKGENDEHKVFQVTQTAIDDIVGLIKKLYNNLQIANFVVTADHGFMYRKKKIDESAKYNNITQLDTLETSKRYMITEGNLDVDYTHNFNLDYLGDNLGVVTAYGYETFKTQGGGINYIHGGTSLQEIIVPIIEVSELRRRGGIDNEPVGVRLKSINRKITTRTFGLEFEQYEKVQDKKPPRDVTVYFEDITGEKISGEYHFRADSQEDSLSSRIIPIRFALKNMEFSRNKQYDLVMVDTEKNEEIDRVPFVINIIPIKPAF